MKSLDKKNKVINLKQLEKEILKGFNLWEKIKWYWYDIELFFTDEIPFRYSLYKMRKAIRHSVKSKSDTTISDFM